MNAKRDLMGIVVIRCSSTRNPHHSFVCEETIYTVPVVICNYRNLEQLYRNLEHLGGYRRFMSIAIYAQFIIQRQ